MLLMLGTIIFWLTIIGLFLAIYFYLGALAYGWYKKRKKKQQDHDASRSL